MTDARKTRIKIKPAKFPRDSDGDMIRFKLQKIWVFE